MPVGGDGGIEQNGRYQRAVMAEFIPGGGASGWQRAVF